MYGKETASRKRLSQVRFWGHQSLIKIQVFTVTLIGQTFSVLMISFRPLNFLQRVGWEFWLPLPLIAALLWLGGNLIAAQVLSRPYDSVHALQVDTQLDVKLSVTILTMNARIDRRRGVTTISVKTTDLTLRKLEYEFPITQASQIEAAIAQDLAMPIASVRKLISYQIKD